MSIYKTNNGIVLHKRESISIRIGKNKIRAGHATTLPQ